MLFVFSSGLWDLGFAILFYAKHKPYGLIRPIKEIQGFQTLVCNLGWEEGEAHMGGEKGSFQGFGSHFD